MADFTFEVYMPLNGHDEDAPPVAKEISLGGDDTQSDDASCGFVIICDGAGGSGANKHPNVDMGDGEPPRTRTSAYVASRKVSDAANTVLTNRAVEIIESAEANEEDKIKTKVDELGNTIRATLDAFVNDQNLSLSAGGSTFKMLPSTLTAVIYKRYKDRTMAIVISVGDSWALMLDAQGLHQLSIEDINSNLNAMSNTSNAGTLISQNNDFHLNYAIYKDLPTHCVLFATSDGLTDKIKPLYSLEKNLIVSFQNAKEWNSDDVKKQLETFIIQGKCNKSDDCTIAGVVLGYESVDDFASNLSERFKKIGARGEEGTILGDYYKYNDPKKAMAGTLDSKNKEADRANIAFRNKIKDRMSHFVYDGTNDAIIEFLIKSIPGFEDAKKSAFEQKKKILDTQYNAKKQKLDDVLFDAYAALIRLAFTETISNKNKMSLSKPVYPVSFSDKRFEKDVVDTIKDWLGCEDVNANEFSKYENQMKAIGEKLGTPESVESGKKLCDGLTAFLKNFQKRHKAAQELNRLFKASNVRTAFDDELQKDFFQLFEWEHDFSSAMSEDLRKLMGTFGEKLKDFEEEYTKLGNEKIKSIEQYQSESITSAINRFSSQIVKKIAEDKEIAEQVTGEPLPAFKQDIEECKKTIADYDAKLDELAATYLPGYEKFKNADLCDRILFPKG